MNLSRRPPPRVLDWREIYARLDQATNAIRDALNPPALETQAVLDERARALAQVPPRTPRAAEVLEVVTFRLGGERYALEARYVTQVLRPTECVPVPGTPGFLAGVVNLRGEILAVMDLTVVLGLDRPGTGPAWILVLGQERDEFGVRADAVLEVATLRVDEVHEPPGSVAGGVRPYLRGVTARALIVLDGQALLRDDRLVVNLGEELGA